LLSFPARYAPHRAPGEERRPRVRFDVTIEMRLEQRENLGGMATDRRPASDFVSFSITLPLKVSSCAVRKVTVPRKRLTSPWHPEHLGSAKLGAFDSK
jgi:hypothetical protein